MLCELDRRVACFDLEVNRVFRSNEPCKRVAKIRGVGPKTAFDWEQTNTPVHIKAW